MSTREQDLVSYVEYNQLQRMSNMNSGEKEKFDQYFTSSSVAKLMASRFDFTDSSVRILDPGAGCGILFTACINKILMLAYLFNSTGWIESYGMNYRDSLN